MFKPAKYNSIPEIETALRLTCESYEVEFRGEFETKGWQNRLRATVYAPVTEDRDVEYNTYAYFWRNGREVVCIIDQYEDEGATFTSTAGKDYECRNDAIIEA